MSSVHHKIILKRKTTEDDDDNSTLTCYCGLDRKELFMFTCEECRRNVHIGCLKSERPSHLLGDIYFKFLCESCAPNFEERFERLNLPWTFVLAISLYNLHVHATSNCGYFKWKTHVCSFIEKNWSTFFGSLRKKTTTWPGTVAGTLSSNSPQLFKSGTVELKEPGWWALTTRTLPSVDDLLQANNRKVKASRIRSRVANPPLTESVGLRNRSSKSSIQAAIELKEKRSKLTEAKEIRQNLALSVIERTTAEDFSEPSTSKSEEKASGTCYWDLPLLHNIKTEIEEDTEIVKNESISTYELPVIKEEPHAEPHASVTEGEPCKDLISFHPFNEFKENSEDWNLQIPGNEEEEEILDERLLGMNVDIVAEDFHFLQSQTIEIEDLMKFNSNDLQSVTEIEVADSTESNGSDSVDNDADSQMEKKKRKFKVESVEAEKHKYILMTEYDEHQLLKRLEKLSGAVEADYSAKRLRRKLILRQKRRESNLPLFDLDEQFRVMSGMEVQGSNQSTRMKVPTCVLDRFQLVCGSAKGHSHTSFVTRLMGFEDEHLESIVSPYTMRTLKPFIFKDYESTPLKMKLLHEIQSYRQTKDSSLEGPIRYPLDFCYVRPYHIPVINNLCEGFFWPGIDLSECLQYPDFSCVVLYRKVIVGFAFMVPDVKYNEVYISFIFTHPEWRNARIASFMIYHLIQTCMGKDVTLHVSATNPAVFLYQKFGFKVEELILDFYDKYLPVKSKECRHALFLRLSR